MAISPLLSWDRAGVTTSVRALHLRTLKSALTWAYLEGLISSQPLAGMRGPGPPDPKRDAPLVVVQALREAAACEVEQAGTGAGGVVGRRRAEQVALLLRLASDTGARRGELLAPGRPAATTPSTPWCSCDMPTPLPRS